MKARNALPGRTKIERFRDLHNIPEYGAVARVTGGNESRAVIHTASGETFKASCTMGPYHALKAAMKKWLESEDKRLREFSGYLVPEKPRVVCLCGSTRFYGEFMEANYQETMAGKIVLSVGFFVNASDEAHGEGLGCTADQKRCLDELHKRKIDLADEILVLNVDGYIGDSTRSEIRYAEQRGKPVRYLEAK